MIKPFQTAKYDLIHTHPLSSAVSILRKSWSNG